jgi:hypothetical protein
MPYPPAAHGCRLSPTMTRLRPSADIIEVGEASERTEVLFIHAPYPWRLRFAGVPSSLLAAATPFVREVAAAGEMRRVGLLDPGDASAEFYAELERLLRAAGVRAVCVSTSTAAIEETGRIARLVKSVDPGLLVIVGGPHEDGCPGSALNLAGVDLSLAGRCGDFLSNILRRFLAQDDPPAAFVRSLGCTLRWTSYGLPVASRHWAESPVRYCRAQPRSALGVSPVVRPARRVRFDVFGGRETIPLMVSRGCSYGRCTFCAEGSDQGAEVASDFSWIADLAASQPEAALYFQDSIFPSGRRISQELLPLLRELGRPWGCQVFFPVTTRKVLHELRAAGCTYLYTGLESGASTILGAVGKSKLTRDLVIERLGWAKEEGFDVGLSLMFGAIARNGQLLETESTLGSTIGLVDEIVRSGTNVVGVYPNILTVLPGTDLARGLASNGTVLDFYAMPRSPEFEAMEDGAVGYNFTTLPGFENEVSHSKVAGLVCRVAADIEALWRCPRK